jgi:hypothetical protein
MIGADARGSERIRVESPDLTLATLAIVGSAVENAVPEFRWALLDGVQERVDRRYALLGPILQAIAARSALLIRNVNRFRWPTLHGLDLDRPALQGPVLQERVHGRSIRRVIASRWDRQADTRKRAFVSSTHHRQGQPSSSDSPERARARSRSLVPQRGQRSGQSD